MSRRTKAELEAENAELKSLVAELEAENKTLRRQLEIQVEQNRDLLHGAERDQSVIKIMNDALTKASLDSSDHVNARNNVIEGYKRGPIEHGKQAGKKKRYLVTRYNHWLAEGKRYGKARELANDELKKQFKLEKGYGTTKLCEFCPKPKGR